MYFNYKMSALEARSCGFVAGIITKAEIPDLIEEIKRLAELPLKVNSCNFLKIIFPFIYIILFLVVVVRWKYR